ncbi:MAG: coenzyme F390 synthetase, partial [Methanomicrobiales archaeon]|nr:coenzyme F390 synthetase [Methanomicrobiales archaeon]
VSMEVLDPAKIDKEGIRDRFIHGFIGTNPFLRKAHDEGSLTFAFLFAEPVNLEIAGLPGRPKRVVDRRT